MSRFSFNDPPAPEEQLWRRLPVPRSAGWTDPAGYIAEEALHEAIETSLWEGRPLLVTGEPGCGKTELANYVAWRLGLSRQTGTGAGGHPTWEHALRFDTKSETRARDLFYTIDLIERFHRAQTSRVASAPTDPAASADPLDPLHFIRFHALGRAIIYARQPDELSERLEPWQRHPGEPRRSVVLIDEIDKAPSDVPNDLLMEIENMRFLISERNEVVAAPPELKPLLIITSNTEKPLPEAFLRRCNYFHFKFPEATTLAQIVSSRVSEVDEDAPLLVDAIEVFERLRLQPLRKKPATAELLGFFQSLRNAGYGLSDRLTGQRDWSGIARVTLLKTRDDQESLIEAPSVAGV